MSSRWLPWALLGALAGLWASTGQAQNYPLVGNARFQLGNGLPIPITATPVPNGKVVAVPGAVVQQTAGPDPKQITMAPGQLTAPGTPKVTLGLFPFNSKVFSVRTSRAVSFPKQQATLRAGGRAGAPTVTFCAGQSVTPTGNPMCSHPAGTANTIHGLLRYTKTLNQFGGPAQAALGGAARWRLIAGLGKPPCTVLTCSAISVLSTPPPTDAVGGPFGFNAKAPAPAQSPGLFRVSAAPSGLITYTTPTGLGPGLPNPLTSFGGPWTTGMLTVSVTQNIGATPQIFVLSGADNRVNGVGSISLVAGALTKRAVNGPEAKRGWLNLTISAPPQPVPGLRALGVAALAVALLSIALRRRRGSAVAPRS